MTDIIIEPAGVHTMETMWSMAVVAIEAVIVILHITMVILMGAGLEDM